MEGPLTMQLHGALFGAVSYGAMRYLMRQNAQTALRRSVLLGNAVATYMIIFGHSLPTL